MSNLTKDMQAYIGTTNEEKQAFALKIYDMANEYLKKYRCYNNDADQIIKNIGEEDLRQDLVTEAFNCLAHGKYDKSKGTKEEFIDLAFDMVLSCHHFEGTEPDIMQKAYYKNPLANFTDSYKHFSKVASFGYVPMISPFTYAKVLGVKAEDICKTFNFKQEEVKNFIKADDFTLSLYKVKAPTKK